MSANESAMTDSTFGDKSQWSLLSTSKPNVATEDHLQSLGFDINDGLPKFKLNQPGPAALASSIFQQNNMVNDESEQSFIVLGKTSLESIREASLASYMEIQQKSVLTDHTSLISMMSPSEIEESLKKVLEENIKLKETLKQNNSAIKQQFNTITMLQKEVMTVCDNHKQKFLETKELISHLKKENEELREKILKNKSQETSLSSNTIGYSFESNVTSLLKKSDYRSTENIPSLVGINFEEGNKSQHNQIQLENEQELLKKIGNLSEELTKVKVDHSKTQEVFEELEVFKKKSDVSNPSELQKLVSKCCEKDVELKYLREIITSLEQQIKKYEENANPLIDLQIEISQESSTEKISLRDNIEFYNLKIGELNKCFASQCSRYLRIQELLKESADIIRLFENTEFLSNSVLSEDKIKNYKDKLCDYRKKLIDEQLQSIDDKQATIKVQKQLQQMLSDYNSVLYKLEILKDENSKLTTLQAKAAEENSQKLAEIEKRLVDEKKSLENEKVCLLEERLNIQMEKKTIIEEKKKIEKDRDSLLLEKEQLKEDRQSLLEEKTSLDRQSKLYEAEEETLQLDKKMLQKKCDDLNKSIECLKQQLNEANQTIQELHVYNFKSKENEEIISAYRIQTEMREKEFEHICNNQKCLQDQLHSLSVINAKLRAENARLSGSSD